MKAIFILIFFFSLFSCTKIDKNTSFNKSITLNSANKMNLDSLKSVSYQDFIKNEKDTITLENDKSVFINLTFKDSLSYVNIQLHTNDFYSQTFVSADNIGCVNSSPKLLFIKDDEVKYDFLIETEKNSNCTYLFSSPTLPYDPYGTNKEILKKEIIYGNKIDKIRLVKNDSTFIDMILNNADRELLHKYSSAKLVEFNY